LYTADYPGESIQKQRGSNQHLMNPFQEVITGQIPYSEFRSEPMVVLAVIQGTTPKRPAEIMRNAKFGQKRWDMLLKCWQKDPDSRPKAWEIRDMVCGFIQCNKNLIESICSPRR
jgi:hypothetical protein